VTGLGPAAGRHGDPVDGHPSLPAASAAGQRRRKASPDGRIRAAVIGFGTSGRVFHAPFLDHSEDYSLDVILTADPGRAAEARRLHPSAEVVPVAEEIWARSDHLDLVVIGSPPETHYGIARRAIDAGIAVVVDKPFATSAAEGAEIVAAASAANVLLTVFQNRRWDGDFLTLSRLVEDGALGEVRFFESRFEWWKPDEAKQWKVAATPAQGGGILMDLGTHLIDQSLRLFGDVTSVYAELTKHQPDGGAEDTAFVALQHTSGVRSHLRMSSLAPQPGPRFIVAGSRAGYTKWGLDSQENQLKQGMAPDDAQFATEPENSWGTLGVEGSAKRIPTRHGDYAAFYVALAEAILHRGPLPVDPADAVRVLELIELIRLSGTTGPTSVEQWATNPRDSRDKHSLGDARK
jgi:predicted dehydrogenase